MGYQEGVMGAMSRLPHKDKATCVSRVSQSRFLSGSADGTVILWDINQPLGRKCMLDIEDVCSPVTSLDYFEVVVQSAQKTALCLCFVALGERDFQSRQQSLTDK